MCYTSTISYDQYDDICAKMGRYNHLKWVPTMDEIREMVNIDIAFFLSMFVNILEADKSEFSDDEIKRIKELNKAVIKNIEFTEDANEALEGKIALPEIKYKQIVKFVTKADIINTDWVPTMRQIDTSMKPYIQYNFALMLYFLYSDVNFVSTREGKYIKKLIKDNFEIPEVEKKIQITHDEYEALIDQIGKVKIRRGNWWPTVAEIDVILKPNIEKCYDFIIWLVKKGRDPQTDEERASKRLLQKLLNDNIGISSEGEIIWS